MQCYRIASSAYITDMAGTGARLYGGRWNHKGSSVIYSSQSRALATAEYLVHVPMSLVPSDLKVATIDISDKVDVETIELKTLPKNWRSYPAPTALADIGNKWINQNRSLILLVPSVVVTGDFNVLINPAHKDIKHVKIRSIDPYELDRRLLRAP